MIAGKVHLPLSLSLDPLFGNHLLATGILRFKRGMNNVGMRECNVPPFAKFQPKIRILKRLLSYWFH